MLSFNSVLRFTVPVPSRKKWLLPPESQPETSTPDVGCSICSRGQYLFYRLSKTCGQSSFQFYLTLLLRPQKTQDAILNAMTWSLSKLWSIVLGSLRRTVENIVYCSCLSNPRSLEQRGTPSDSQWILGIVMSNSFTADLEMCCPDF